MSTFTVSKRLPTILVVLLSSLLFAIAVIGFAGCSTDTVTTLEEKERLSQLDAQEAATSAEVHALEKQAEAAGKAYLAAVKAGDVAGQQAALDQFNAIHGDWKAANERLMTIVTAQSEIITAAQDRAIAPLKASAGLLGLPPGIVEAGAALVTPWVFDRSRKALLQTLKTRAKQGIVPLLLSPFEAYFRAFGLGESSTTPDQALNTAAGVARKNKDAELEIAIRTLMGDPALRARIASEAVPVGNTMKLAVDAVAVPSGT